MPKKLKITDPRMENKINVKNAVREPFLAISILYNSGTFLSL